MREDRFHYRNKMNAEYSAWPGPGAYQPLVSGIGKQVKSQHTTRPNCRFGAEGRFGGKDPRTTHGQGPDPIGALCLVNLFSAQFGVCLQRINLVNRVTEFPTNNNIVLVSQRFA